MIRKEKMKITSSRVIAKDTVEMVLENRVISENAIPGQFLHIQIETNTLRRPISIADLNKESSQITILFKIHGEGTSKLANYQQGELLDVLGPVGNGFPITLQTPSTVLLIGGGIGVPPLYYLGKMLKERGINIVSVLGFQQKDHVFYEQQFQELGQTFIVTDNGTYGQKGFVTDVLDQVDSFDRYYSCGPLPMLKALTSKLKGKEGYISLEERMGCGIGACFACVIPTTEGNGYKKLCRDGPVFQAEEVTL